MYLHNLFDNLITIKEHINVNKSVLDKQANENQFTHDLLVTGKINGDRLICNINLEQSFEPYV